MTHPTLGYYLMMDPLQKILISSCLLGDPVRYDGRSKPVNHLLIEQWRNEGRLISVCPEVSGGLPIPRPAAEIQRLSGDTPNLQKRQVITIDGQNVSDAFDKGAAIALHLCRLHQIKIAVLKQFSPSCGSDQIYDGTFSGVKITGVGVTCQLLRENGIAVFSEQTLDQIASYLHQLT
ncbi:MAG: hypothetical protein ACI8WB_003088 [Phenylobacterium sp.]|jgi:uncharacterized protein YbbK (DUF523 family)